MLADHHYSRQSPGHREFMPPGKTMVLRDSEGTIVFGWIHQKIRDDGQAGYCCSIFRNESSNPHRLSSDVILDAERAVFSKWGPDRLFTYIDAEKLIKPVGKFRKPKIPGKCFHVAGWKIRVKKNGKPHLSKSGLILLVKPHHSD